VQTGHLFLGGQQALPHPFRPANAPLQPHPSIVDIPSHPQPGPVNDGWEENLNKLVSGIANWPNNHKKQPEPVIAHVVTSTNSFAQNQPCIEIKSSSLKLPTDEKGKKPMDKSSSSESSKSAFVHSKASTKELQGDSRKEISHVDMFPWKYLNIDASCL
jgi:hypothetical protein